MYEVAVSIYLKNDPSRPVRVNLSFDHRIGVDIPLHEEKDCYLFVWLYSDKGGTLTVTDVHGDLCVI